VQAFNYIGWAAIGIAMVMLITRFRKTPVRASGISAPEHASPPNLQTISPLLNSY
jgi:hypothetical protein